MEVPLCKSTKERRSTILDDCVVYLKEHEYDIGLENDLISFTQVKPSVKFKKMDRFHEIWDEINGKQWCLASYQTLSMFSILLIDCK